MGSPINESGHLRVEEDWLDERGPGIGSVETHVSTLTFRNGLVHKRKKAVHFGFIDLSTAAKREQICHREVELNQRFSPDVYLGVEDVVRAGSVIDHAVLMREMPGDRRLATMIARDEDVSGCLDAIAAAIAAFHRTSTTSDEIASVATPDALHDLWDQSLHEIDGLACATPDRDTVADVQRLAHRYLDGRGPLIAERITDGHIVDGHGDLLADDVFCLDDGPRILDCLEFDDRLRWGDVINDVGFLAMDLERLGRDDLASVFMADYRKHSGERHPSTLEDHYVAYRALVRAKVSYLRGTSDALTAAHAYLGQCHRHLRAGRIRLVVVGGLPGTGKTALATAMGDELGWPVLHSDVIRKERVGLDLTDHVPSSYGTGLYTTSMIDETYDELCARARQLLTMGRSTILDASFATDVHRRTARSLAESTASDLYEVRCLLPATEAHIRLIARRADSSDASDAGPEVAGQMAQHFDHWASAFSVGTLAPIADVLPAVIDHIDTPRRPQRTGRDH
jgi:aminoglycoside phosphotransferase family enzyme/predicted kinase